MVGAAACNEQQRVLCGAHTERADISPVYTNISLHIYVWDVHIVSENGSEMLRTFIKAKMHDSKKQLRSRRVH